MTRRPHRLAALALSALALAVGGCGGDDEESETAARTVAEPTETTGGVAPPTDERTASNTAPREEPEPPPGAEEVWAGARRGGPPGTYIRFANQLVEPTLVEPANGATVVDLRWSGWGEEGAAGAGIAEVDSCDPSCAAGGLIRRPGARVTLLGLREGRCRGKPGRFYTRARFEWPRGSELPSHQSFPLAARCPAQ
jgi:hypothetical protein